MAGVKTLADGRTKLAILTTKPANPAAPTLTELNAGISAAGLVAKNGTRVTASNSDTVNDPELSSNTNAPTWAASNFEGSIAPFWLLDATTGAYSAGDNAVYEALTPKGTTVFLAFREGPLESAAWAAGDKVDLFEVTTDNPQRPTETGAWIKRIIPLGVQNAWLDGTATAGT